VNQCIYSKEYFDSADGEHILQNFLGARWTSTEIASNTVQHQFGRTIDVALADGLKDIRNLLGTRGGRGESGPSLKNIRGSKGTKFTVAPGGKAKISEPIIKTKSIPGGGKKIQIVLGDMKQFDWAIAKLKMICPMESFDIEELRRQTSIQSGSSSEALRYRGTLGGAEFFRGALKSIFNLLGASSPGIAMLDAFDEVRLFILNGEGDFEKFVHWLTVSESLEIPRIGEFDQFMTVYSQNGYVDGYIQFFGEIGFLLRLAEKYSGPEFHYSYVVDSFRSAEPAEIRNPYFDKKNIPIFDSGRALPDETVWPAMVSRYSRILDKYYQYLDRKNLSRIFEGVFLPYDGRKITQEMIEELSNRAADYMTRRIFMNKKIDEVGDFEI